LLQAEIEDEESEDEEQDLLDAYNFSDDEFDVNERESNAFQQTNNLMDGPHHDLEEIKEADDGEEFNEESF
jgi:hypothetical protein